MSKKRVLELIGMDDEKLINCMMRVPVQMTPVMFRQLLLDALSDQDRDTSNGCAEAVLQCNGHFGGDWIWKSDAHGVCMNYIDKDLEKLSPYNQEDES
jgi:hypothetical protein